MALALAVSCAGFVSPARLSRPAVAVSRGPAGFSMKVKGLGGDSDTRPVEMIHADADAAFKMLDSDSDGSIDDAELKEHLFGRGYTEELVAKVFAGIDVDSDGTLSSEVRPAPSLIVRVPPWVRPFGAPPACMRTSAHLTRQELRVAFVKFPTLCKAFEVEKRSVWPAMDDGKSEAATFACSPSPAACSPVPLSLQSRSPPAARASRLQLHASQPAALCTSQPAALRISQAEIFAVADQVFALVDTDAAPARGKGPATDPATDPATCWSPLATAGTCWSPSPPLPCLHSYHSHCTAPMHPCTTAPLHHCTAAPLHPCTSAPLQGNGDISVAELKGYLLDNDWEEPLVTKVRRSKVSQRVSQSQVGKQVSQSRVSKHGASV